MPSRFPLLLGLRISWLCWAAALLAISAAHAQTTTENVIFTFPYLADGSGPDGVLIRDADGNLYGTASAGGAGAAGVVFQLGPSGEFTVLHNFTGGTDGANPVAGVIQDPSGNLYGTTCYGGGANAGVVYRITPAGEETILHNFNVTDGANPYAGVVRDGAGNLFGATLNGGEYHAGVVYKLSPDGKETVLHDFGGSGDGSYPNNVIQDSAGNIYGTTQYGGGNGCSKYGGCGTVFKLTPAGAETILYAFTGKADGEEIDAGVVMDSDGNLYGTAAEGGVNNRGTVWELNPAGQLTVLYSFAGGATGGLPYTGVTRDAAGNLYGTTGGGGGVNLDGVVYKLDATGQFTVLYSFPGASFVSNDVSYSSPNVMLDPAGNLYGETAWGGPAGLVYEIDTTGAEKPLHNFPVAPDGIAGSLGFMREAGEIYGTTTRGGTSDHGAVFEVNAAGKETVIYSFTGGKGGAEPNPGLVRDAAGNFYGTTPTDGAYPNGMLFQLEPSGTLKVLHVFSADAEGGSPNPGLVLDGAGNLYGTTTGANSCGVIYEFNAAGTYTVLYSFTCGAGGAEGPAAGVVFDSAGNLYGTTTSGGANASGTIYKLDTSGQLTILYSFPAPPVEYSACEPYTGVIIDSASNLYGATAPSEASCGYNNGGEIYKLDTAGSFSVLYTFTGGSDGSAPGNLVMDSAGNIYGAAMYGGVGGCNGSLGASGCGVIFKLDPSGNESVLYSFTPGTGGTNPVPAILRDSAGNLWGTTGMAVANGGVVYEIPAP